MKLTACLVSLLLTPACTHVDGLRDEEPFTDLESIRTLIEKDLKNTEIRQFSQRLGPIADRLQRAKILHAAELEYVSYAQAQLDFSAAELSLTRGPFDLAVVEDRIQAA